MKKRKRKTKIRNTLKKLKTGRFWLFVIIGLIAGWFAFPLAHVFGLALGLIGGIYLGLISPTAKDRLDKPMSK